MKLPFKITIEKDVPRETIREVKVVKVPNNPTWSKEHSLALSAFMRSEIGKDFCAKMESIEIMANEFAVSKLGVNETRDERIGIAQGIKIAFGNIRLLGNCHPEQPADHTDEDLEKIIVNRIGGNL